MGEKYKNNVKFIFFSPIIVVENEKLSRMRGMLIYYLFKKRPYIVPHQPLPQNLLSGFSQTCPP